MASILIVDDAAFMRMMIKDILSKTDTRLLAKPRMVSKQWKNSRNSILIL